MDTANNGTTPIPSDIEVHETVLAGMRSIKGQDTAVDYLSPVVTSPTKTGHVFRFNDQEDKGDTDDKVGPFDESPIVEFGIEGETFSCKPHRRSVVLASENTVQDDTGLLSLANIMQKPVDALHLRRSRTILTRVGTVSNYAAATRYDVNALWTKWGLAGSDPQDNIQRVIEEKALLTGLSEQEVAGNIFIYAGRGVTRALQTKVVGTIHSNAGDSKLVKQDSIMAYLGVAGYRTAFASHNKASRGNATSDREWMYPTDMLTLFYRPSNPATETPMWMATVRFTGADLTGRPAVGGWTVEKGDPPISMGVARDWYDNAVFDWNGASVLYNVV